MTPLELITARKAHLNRLANERGAEGERGVRVAMTDWTPRPTGARCRTLLSVLAAAGKPIKASAFDALVLPPEVDLDDAASIGRHLDEIIFIEIKTANQKRVKPGFEGFFFALTENEIMASDLLGDQHRVALFNNLTGEILMTSVPDIVARAKSSTWQLSLQL